jgi:hypothetical protein
MEEERYILMEKELYDVYIVMIPARNDAFEAMADSVVEWTSPALGAGRGVSYEEALSLMEELES